jgi:ADP-ribosyl-[dinitrogen reductase] hydrolase
MVEDKQKGMFVGLAIGDTLGMPLEFKQRGTFQPLETLSEGGPFNLPLGYWTDDTSMALCLADSILTKKGYDSYDVMDRYANWQANGYRSSTGVCFDIGNQVSSAITHYKAQPEVAITEQRTESAGNGCIMRLAPVVIASIAASNNLEETMQLAAISGRETHFSVYAEEATALFAGMLFNAVRATNKDQVLQLDKISTLNTQLLATVKQANQKTVDELKPTGYVLDTLEVAVWAFMTTDNFKEGALNAINLGGDSDTIGAVYGQLAGAYYGLTGIPKEWIEQLHDYDEIVKIAEQLSTLKDFGIIRTRFAEDKESELVQLGNKEHTMTDDNQPQEPLTDKDKDVLKSWSNVGSPGPAPTAPFVPTEEQRQQFKPINSPKTLTVNWKLDQEAYKRLQLGHVAHEMEDKWNVYMEDGTVHFHRSWTGMELFRFTLQPAENGSYTVSQFEVEQDPERYTETDEQAIRNTLSEVLQAVLGVGLANTDQ